MNAATVDQAENMFKNLTNPRQFLDKCDDEDQDTVKIDGTEHDVNDKMDEWIKKICIYKDKNKKKEKREDREARTIEATSSYVAEFHCLIR